MDESMRQQMDQERKAMLRGAQAIVNSVLDTSRSVDKLTNSIECANTAARAVKVAANWLSVVLVALTLIQIYSSFA